MITLSNDEAILSFVFHNRVIFTFHLTCCHAENSTRSSID